jgi:urease accessory protein
MLVQNKIGNLSRIEVKQRQVDHVLLEWHETRKRIFRKTTALGETLSIRFLNENPELNEGDVLFADDSTIIAVNILPCDCIVIQPKNMFEMASVCYEIGNKHLPLFYEADELLVPFEQPLFKLLLAQGYDVKQERRKLLQPLKTTVSPHGDSDSLFSKIMKLTSTAS